MIQIFKPKAGWMGLALALSLISQAAGFSSVSLSALRKEAPLPEVPEVVGAPLAFQSAEPSRSYQTAVYNNDGSVRLISPFFRNPAGQGAMHVSSKSDYNGVCRLYGFGAVQAVESEGDYNKTAVIDASGRLSGFRDYDRYGALNSRLREIFCGPTETSPRGNVTVQERSSAVHVNDDGSTTIVSPFVAGAGGEQVPLAAQGSLRGVCRYFGFGAYVASTASGDVRKTVWIGPDGRISGLRFYDQYGAANTRLDSIVCR